MAKHAKVQFRCTRCGQNTIVEVKRRADETIVISPLPSFARADAQTASLHLPPVDDGLRLPEKRDIVLHVISGPDQGQELVLKTARAVIGRTGADFALNDPEVSRNHCLLEVRNNYVSLKDLESTNGTFFQEERARVAMLQDGAEFRIGNSTIQLIFRPK